MLATTRSTIIKRLAPSLRVSLLPVGTNAAFQKILVRHASTISERDYGKNVANTRAVEDTSVLLSQPQRDIYQGIAKEPFSKEISNILMAPLLEDDIEIKPDGIIYLPEILYRRVLNKAFGPGGWALMPMSPPIHEGENIIRTFALYCHGRFVAEAIGEQIYLPSSTLATCAEAAKSNALVRCCKDLGVGSELWDPKFIFEWKKSKSVEVFCDNIKTKASKKLWRRKDRPAFEYPWQEKNFVQSMSAPKLPAEAGFSAHEVDEDDRPTRVYKKSPPQQQQQQQQVQQVQQQEQEQTGSDEWPIDDIVPSKLKRYAGKSWRELLMDPKSAQYLSWASTNMSGDGKDLAVKFLEYIEKKGGPENILVSSSSS